MVVTHDYGDDILIYINGTEGGYYYNDTQTSSESASYLYLGETLGGDRDWNGLIDQVLIYNRVLTAEEVSALYNSGNGLSYWDF